MIKSCCDVKRLVQNWIIVRSDKLSEIPSVIDFIYNTVYEESCEDCLAFYKIVSRANNRFYELLKRIVSKSGKITEKDIENW